MPLSALDNVPAGRWAIAVSGGADSVALLLLLRARVDVHLHVVHLNHELRGAEADDDARFVADLAGKFGLPSTIRRRSEVETQSSPGGVLAKNKSARYRAARLALFREVVAEHRLAGVLLAHHADDQAETVLHRLLRGSGWAGLCGMRDRGTVGDLLMLRPLLAVRRAELRSHLAANGQNWREDSSNVSDRYLRNRLRRLLSEQADLTDALLRLATHCQQLRKWVSAQTPRLDATFPAIQLATSPGIIAQLAATRWLAEQGAVDQSREVSTRSVQMLLEMARDAATPSRRQMAGGVMVSRRRGQISACLP